jgi:hypothetical protein
MKLGYLVEGVDEAARPAVGRPVNLVSVDAGRALFIGVKVTGDEIIAVLADLCCRIRVSRHVDLTGREPQAVLPAITALVQELLTEAVGFGVPVRGLGIAISGDVDRANGLVRYSPFLEWRDVPLAELAGTATVLPVTVDNDVRALTVAEHWFGAGVGLRAVTGPLRGGAHEPSTARGRHGSHQYLARVEEVACVAAPSAGLPPYRCSGFS